jgi:glucose/arabinose dehydrogenase
VTRVYDANDVGAPATFQSTGLAFGPDGALYVLGNTDEGAATRALIRRGAPADNGMRIWTTVMTTEPYEKSNTQFDHLFNGIVVSPDNRYLYVNSGSRTDHGEVQDSEGAFPNARETPLTSAIFRIPLDAADHVLPNDEAQLNEQGYLFADGVRNAYDMVFAPNGDLIAGDNGPDADYPEELNWLREGQHYGFPWRLGAVDNPQQFPDYDPAQDLRLQPKFFAVKNGFYHNDPDFPAPPTTFTDPIVNLGPDGDIFKEADGSVVDMSDSGRNAATFTPHRSPLGLVFDSEEALAEDLKGDLFVLSWGAAEGDLPDPGRDLLHVELTKHGERYEARVTQLVVGFDRPIDGVLVGKRLYVLDWGGAGAVWEVTLP